MMKKSKIFITLALVVASGFLGVLASTSNVEAANNECSAGYTKATYMDKIKYSYNGNIVSFTGAQGLLYTTNYDSEPHLATGGFTITLDPADINKRLEVTFYLPGDDGVCPAMKQVGQITAYSGASARNNLYDNALCVNYRNKWGNNETMRNAVSYCFEQQTSIQYSYDEVSTWINNAERLYSGSNSTPQIEIDPSYQEVTDVKNTDKLVCDAFNTGNYENPHKYYHIETESENNCKVTCKEEIEVNFSDPVATQAGLCFQYLIEIKSKVECDASYTAPLPSRPTVCVPTPYCVSSNGYESDKGGPNEDFDACVKECDGGDYTQKCIDSCYNKVYIKGNYKASKTTNYSESTSNNLLTFDNKEYRAFKVANSCLDPTTINRNDASQVQALYEQHQRDPGGYYAGKTWIPATTGCSSDVGQFYFATLDRTKDTVTEMQGAWVSGSSTKKYCADSGFLKRCERNGYASWCSDSCSWQNNCGSNTVLTDYIAEQQYQKELAEYEAAKKACESKAATCTNETTDYQIIVENKDSNDTDSNKEDWTEEFNSSQKLNSNKVTGDFTDMVTLIDGECEDGQPDDWAYHNIITFPGTWVNNKTGQTAHSIEPGYEDFYTFVGNQYCTKLNSVPVNTAWYDWKVNQNGDPNALTDSEKSSIMEVLDMNIKGSIENYGYFGWNFDVECFYAINEPDDNRTNGDDPGKGPGGDPGDNDDGGTPSCKPGDPDFPKCNDGDPNDSETVNNFEFRTVSLDNLFPSNESGKTSREAGFNWTCDATNLENKDYLIQPVALKNEIERLGDDIYDGDTYLDYHIVLTPETMNKVRKYNKDVGSYSEPAGTEAEKSGQVLSANNNKTAGITVYRSYLLHKVLNSSELLKSGLIGCNNETEGQCQKTIIDDTEGCYREYQAQSSILKGANS